MSDQTEIKSADAQEGRGVGSMKLPETQPIYPEKRGSVMGTIGKIWLYGTSFIGSCGCLAGIALMVMIGSAVWQMGSYFDEIDMESTNERRVTVVEKTEDPDGEIAVVSMRGVIQDYAEEDIFGQIDSITPDPTQDLLEELISDANVKAIVLEIDSPGGTTHASYEIYNLIANTAQEKPVVAYFSSVAASGGYYIAAPASAIVAHPETITGSIGVIFGTLNMRELGEKIGVSDVTIKSGEHKDIGNAWRDMTPEERTILQEMVDESYDRFISVVDQHRDINAELRTEVLDGRILTASQAVNAGLADAVGNLHDATEKAKELAEIDEADVVRYKRDTFWQTFFRSGLQNAVPWYSKSIAPPQQQGKLLYLWDGGLN